MLAAVEAAGSLLLTDPLHGGAVATRAYAASFEALNCRVVAKGQVNLRAWFCDLESLVFYMKASPFPEDFDPVAHVEPFNRYLAAAAGPHGYETNEASDLLVVQRA
ncbi:hypothetical protein [Actinopolymorpha pittospori]|uniref:Uncharacterized protein n=1 Tax=Actinopolymorpha pittospori TaxID=648752 RepID=A0A927MS61_9ACTN|nr:hypothetical protein [Actinopolymorpha pittospori]MBE1604253.1 hypothetical protein [Actinopolymorpha pittospori]